MKIIIALIIFSLIICFHELGHFSVAKFFGVRVNEFTLGLGPQLIGVTKGETTYCLKLLPFGGSCVMEGEDEESDDERAFSKKPLWQKFLIVFAGPFFNFVLAFFLSLILVGATGYNPPVLEGVMADSPAEQAGLAAGDEVIAMNGYRVHFYNEIRIYGFFHPGQEVTMTYKRDGQITNVRVEPVLNEETGSYLYGVIGANENRKGNFLEVVQYSCYEIRYQVYMVVQSLKMLFTGKLSLNDMSGPVGIVKTIGDTYDQSIAVSIFSMAMSMVSIAILISANLGVMNLIPFPALDGGRLLIFIIEGIIRRKFPEKVENAINVAGFAILMLFMVLIMGNDIRKLFVG